MKNTVQFNSKITNPQTGQSGYILAITSDGKAINDTGEEATLSKIQATINAGRLLIDNSDIDFLAFVPGKLCQLCEQGKISPIKYYQALKVVHAKMDDWDKGIAKGEAEKALTEI